MNGRLLFAEVVICFATGTHVLTKWIVNVELSALLIMQEGNSDYWSISLTCGSGQHLKQRALPVLRIGAVISLVEKLFGEFTEVHRVLVRLFDKFVGGKMIRPFVRDRCGRVSVRF